MSEPLLQAQAAAAVPGEGLWHQAPAWRSLTVAASLLTLAAVAVPALLPQEQPMPVPLAALETVSATPSVTLPPFVPAHRLRTASAVPRSEPATPVCSIAMGAPRVMSGIITGFIPHEQSLQIFANTGNHNGGIVNPAWRDDARVMVRPDPGTNGGSHNPVIPAGMTVAPGDHVTYVTPSLDSSRPCSFIPSHVVSDQGPPPRAAGDVVVP